MLLKYVHSRITQVATYSHLESWIVHIFKSIWFLFVDKQPLTCCTDNGTFAEDATTNPLCAPIPISCDDPIYSSQGKICMDFIRTRSTEINNCTAPNVPAEPVSVYYAI